MENYKFDDNLKILVIGAGSAACQIISSIKEQCLLRDQARQEAKKSQKIDELNDSDIIDFLAVDSDEKLLTKLNLPLRQILLLDADSKSRQKNLSKIKGRKAVIRELLQKDNIYMLVLIAPLGGETGSKVAIEIAEIAKELHIYTIALASVPFTFEGNNSYSIATTAIQMLNTLIDSVAILPSDLIIKRDKELTLMNAFKILSTLFSDTFFSIIDILKKKGVITIDFADLRSILHNLSIIISETSSEENPIQDTLQKILRYAHLTDKDVNKSKSILLNIFISAEFELLMEHIQELQYFFSKFDKQKITWGVAKDPTLKEKAKIVAIFSGLNDDEFETVTRTDPQDIIIEQKKPTYLTEYIDRIHNDFPGKKAFIIMSFQQTPIHAQIHEVIKKVLNKYKISALRADDIEYTDDLMNNILAYIYACDFGIAVHERITTENPNSNVAMEIGIFIGLGKPVCLLKERTLNKLNSDLAGKLYKEFDSYNIEQTLIPVLEKWIKDKRFIS